MYTLRECLFIHDSFVISSFIILLHDGYSSFGFLGECLVGDLDRFCFRKGLSSYSETKEQNLYF